MINTNELNQIVKPIDTKNEKIIIDLNDTDNVFIKLPVSNNESEIILYKKYLQKLYNDNIDDLNELIYNAELESIEYLNIADIEYFYNLNDIITAPEVLKYFGGIFDRIELNVEDGFYNMYQNILYLDEDLIYNAFYDYNFNYTEEYLKPIIKDLLEDYYNIYQEDYISNIDYDFLSEYAADHKQYFMPVNQDLKTNMTYNMIELLTEEKNKDNYNYESIIYEYYDIVELSVIDRITELIDYKIQYLNNITDNNIKVDIPAAFLC